MSIFKLEDFNFSYDKDKNALTNLNLEIIENSITAIIGGNGAGKSTFLLSLNGINQPNNGRLLFRDKEVRYKKKDLVELRQKVGVVFQNPDDQLFLDDGIKDI
ncbi:MAG: ATP-binding cassette domain-containing protein [Erysipelotrichales bacterium]